jgi:aryl-alcohol dehydrogenase-like predicted oxidoreductase
LTESLEKSLARLQTDYLDLYQLHCPSIGLIEKNGETLAALRAFVAEGKVRAIGISVRSPDEGLMAAEGFGFQSIQVNFSLVDQRAALNGLMGLCKRNGIGIIVRTPLCFGFLTGKYSAETSFDSRDHRSSWPQAQKKLWAEAPRLFLDAFEDRPGQTMSQRALRYCLSYEAVSSVIPGMLNRAHVEENARASDMGALSDRERSKLEEAYRKHAFFLGKD